MLRPVQMLYMFPRRAGSERVDVGWATKCGVVIVRCISRHRNSIEKGIWNYFDAHFKEFLLRNHTKRH